MAKFTVMLDQRESSKVSGNKYPLVLRISHKGKNRYVPFNVHLKPDQYDSETGKITGILKSVRKSNEVLSKRTNIDIWYDDDKSMINLWSVDKIKDEVEKRFFGKQSSLTLLGHSAKYLHRYVLQGQHSTVNVYEDSLKAFIKYKLKLAGKPYKIRIKTLFKHTKEDIENGIEDSFEILEKFKAYDMPIRAIDAELMKDFKAHMSKTKSRNTMGMFLRSLNALLNDASDSFDDLKGHTPLAKIKKGSHENPLNPLTIDEITLIRNQVFDKGTSAFHTKNYFLFMFDNIGMNFYDIALLKVSQLKDGFIQYFRKKTLEEGDYFSIKQKQETLDILTYYIDGKQPDDYIFPILRKGIPPERVHLVKNNKIGQFNRNMTKIAQQIGINKRITTYTARDSWTDIGQKKGYELKQLSDALGHSSIEVTNKHYQQSIRESVLNEMNAIITAPDRKPE